jgi:hypothetical protein
MISKFQARENNEERNKIQRESTEENQYVDMVCFSMKLLNIFVQ